MDLSEKMVLERQPLSVLSADCKNRRREPTHYTGQKTPIRVSVCAGAEWVLSSRPLLLYLDMTAEENLKEQYRILGLPSFADIPELLCLVGLNDTGKKKAKNFSLGMRQRLGIAVALAGSPDFLVLDEPVNGLDPQGIIEMRELILKLNREKQITVLISSHILDELSRLATCYGFIDNGRMVKEIGAKELEAACRKCIRIQVSTIKPLALTLDRMGIDYHILSDTMADIFAKINISQACTRALLNGHGDILSVTEREETLGKLLRQSDWRCTQ